LIELLIATCLVIGTFFIAVSALGLLRLPDIYSRMHAVTKASTLGMAGILGASIFTFAPRGDLVLGEVLTMWFVFLTNPLGGHMIARSAYLIGIRMWEGAVVDELNRAGIHGGADHDTI
jgi:multicomponent Na+:H+ antiporter subunit G